MHPRPGNRAARRAVALPYWLDVERSCRHRQRARRLRAQRVRRAKGIRARIAYHDGDYHGRNVWRG